jgi:prepilin-type N-terminal cleavage/methylation domain-containing protein
MNMSSSRGFTLVEVLVVASITVMITGLLVQNFARSRVDMNQTVLTVTDAIREAQSNALSGALLSGTGTYRCGYGIHFTSTGYLIFAGPDSSGPNCTAVNYTYTADSNHPTVRVGLIASNVLEILPVSDIFFEPPTPTTYLGGVSTAGQSVDVKIRRKGAACPSSDCRTIHVTTSGQIQAQ